MKNWQAAGLAVAATLAAGAATQVVKILVRLQDEQAARRDEVLEWVETWWNLEGIELAGDYFDQTNDDPKNEAKKARYFADAESILQAYAQVVVAAWDFKKNTNQMSLGPRATQNLARTAKRCLAADEVAQIELADHGIDRETFADSLLRHFHPDLYEPQRVPVL